MDLVPRIPESELSFQFSRASGAGGQNVNKRSTKAQLRWRPSDSIMLSPEQRVRVMAQLAGRLTDDGELVIEAEESRSQVRNRELAIERLQLLVSEALAPEIPRKPTRPTRASRRKRLEKKTIHAKKKRERRSPLETD